MKKKSAENLEQRIKAADPLNFGGAPELDVNLAARISNSKIRRRSNSVFAMAGLAAVGLIALSIGSSQQPKPLFSIGSSASNSITMAENGAAGQQPGQPASEATSTAANDAAQGFAAGKMMMPYVSYQYFGSEKLSQTGSTGSVYQFAYNGNPKSSLEDFAKFFGLTDSPELQFSDEFSTSYLVGPKDYTSATVSLYTSPGNTGWNFNNPDGYVQPDCIEKDEFGCTRWEEIKADPAKMPSAEEVTKKLSTLAKIAGWGPSNFKISQTRNEWGVSAAATLQLDGKPIAIEIYASWGQNGVLNYAGGQLGQLIKKGSFETVSAKEASDRANDWRWSASAHHSLYNYPELAQPMLLKTSPEVSCESDCQPAKEFKPEVKNVELTSARVTPVVVYSQTGSIWVVPGYLYESEVGSIAVIALIEGVIELPKASEAEVMPLDAGVSR